MDVGSYFEQDVSFPWIVERSDDAVDGKGQAVGTDPASTENKQMANWRMTQFATAAVGIAPVNTANKVSLMLIQDDQAEMMVVFHQKILILAALSSWTNDGILLVLVLDLCLDLCLVSCLELCWTYV